VNNNFSFSFMYALYNVWPRVTFIIFHCFLPKKYPEEVACSKMKCASVKCLLETAAQNRVTDEKVSPINAMRKRANLYAGATRVNIGRQNQLGICG